MADTTSEYDNLLLSLAAPQDPAVPVAEESGSYGGDYTAALADAAMPSGYDEFTSVTNSPYIPSIPSWGPGWNGEPMRIPPEELERLRGMRRPDGSYVLPRGPDGGWGENMQLWYGRNWDWNNGITQQGMTGNQIAYQNPDGSWTTIPIDVDLFGNSGDWQQAPYYEPMPSYDSGTLPT